MRLTHLFFALGLVCLASEVPAHACKRGMEQTLYLQQLELPEDSTVGPLPLLVSFVAQGSASLTTADGTAIPIVPAPELDGLSDGNGIRIRAWRPASPLPAGEYRWTGATTRTLFVDPAALPQQPPTLSDASFEVVIDRELDDAGCNDSDCADIDFSHLAVELTSDVARPLVLLEVEALTDDTTYTIVGQFDPDVGIKLWDEHFDRSMGNQPICVTLTPIAADGTFGEAMDLGCSNPDSGKHIDDRDGCASTDTTNAWAMLAALGIVASRCRRVLT